MIKRPKVLGISLLVLTFVAASIYGLKNSPAFGWNQASDEGILQAPSVKVTAMSAGVVKAIATKEGLLVTMNQDLAMIENLELEKAVFKAEAQLEVANARLQQVNSGVRAEDKAVLAARVNGQQAVVNGLQKTIAETNQILSKMQDEQGVINGSLIEHIAHLDKLANEHSGHQNEPGHVHQPEDDGKAGMDCAQLVADLGNINKVLTQMNQLGNTADKLGLKTAGATFEAQVALFKAEAGKLANELAQAKKELDIAKAQLVAANAGPRQEDVNMAHAQVKEAQVNLELAKKELERKMILSSVNGLVLKQEINVEQYVNPGTIAFTLADLDNMWVEVKVEPGKYQVDSSVKVTAKQVPNKEFLGRVVTLSTPGGVDSLVRIKVDNSEKLLKPGMDLKVTLN